MKTTCRIGGPSLIAALLLVVSTAASLPAQVSNAQLEGLEELAFKQAAALAAPSIVRIETVGGFDRVGGLLAGTGATTGVVLSEDGTIISSAFNFASQPTSILITLSDGRRFPARRVADDRSRMLTLLKIDATGLVPAVAAKKQSFQVGQWSIALGRTYGTGPPNVSVGIVSALNRIWGKAIQTDAKVSPTNYGGPLVDIEGRVMGILVPLSPQRGAVQTAGVEWYDSGIGFAVPLEDIYPTLDRLKDGEDLMPGLMGMTLKGRNLFAGSPIIDRIRYDSPAQKAGLKSGDKIIKIDDSEVSRQAHVLYALGNKLAGEAITVTVERNAEVIQAQLTLVAELQPYESAFLGILPMRPGSEDSVAEGVGVRFVYSDSPAAKAGLKNRDRIVQINDVAVTEAGQLSDVVSRIRPDESATLTYRRGGDSFTVEVKLSHLPSSILPQLSPAVIPAAKNSAAQPDDAPKTGRFSQQHRDGEHVYWAYVPDDYNPAYGYSLMVWIHPNGDAMEAPIFKQWKSICDQRGLILLAPKALQASEWNLNEAESVKDVVESFQEQYSIESTRIFLHAYSSGGRFASHLTFKYREMFRGLVLAASPLSGRPPDSEPDYRQQLHFVCGNRDITFVVVRRTVAALRQMKYPVSFSAVEGLANKYPPAESIREIGRWADTLDRI